MTAIKNIPITIITAPIQTIGATFQPSIPIKTPIIIQQKNGPQNEYAPLHAIPSAAPHIELPLYHKEKANNAKKPLITKNINDDVSVKADFNKFIPNPIFPSIKLNKGNKINKLNKPEVVCLIIIPISESIRDVPYPATTPSIPHPKAAIKATTIPKTVPFLTSPVIPEVPIKTLAKTQTTTPKIILLLSFCLKMILAKTAPIAGHKAVIGIIIEPANCNAII